MKIFDVHVHIFPEKIADKAVSAIGTFYENFNMEGDGTLETAIRAMDAAGVTRCAAHSVATTAHQVESINDFVMDAWRRYPDRILPFAAMHPDLPDARATAEAAIARGFKGVKIHPEIQGFKLDDPAVLDMLAPFEGKLPILVHCGDYRYDNSSPERVKRVLRTFPRLRLICAHLGGWTVWREAWHRLAGGGCLRGHLLGAVRPEARGGRGDHTRLRRGPGDLRHRLPHVAARRRAQALRPPAADRRGAGDDPVDQSPEAVPGGAVKTALTAQNRDIFSKSVPVV